MQLALTKVFRSAYLILGSALFPALGQADVLIVDAQGGGDFTDVQSAVDAAANGDTLVVRDGNYPGFTVANKGLRIVAERGAEPLVSGAVTVRDLAAGKAFVLSGITARPPASTDLTQVNGLILFNDLGAVRIHDCAFIGADNGPGVGFGNGTGGYGALLTGNADVIVSRSSFQGGRGAVGFDCCSAGGQGGEGLRANTTHLALYDCQATGGLGGESGWGGRGGNGATIAGFELFAAGTVFSGGSGGVGNDFIFGPGGDGGDGLFVASSAAARLRDNAYAGGPGGVSASFSPDLDGAPGFDLFQQPGSLVVQLPGAARRFTAPPSAWEGGAFTVKVEGEPGDKVWFASARQTGFLFVPSTSGVWALLYPVKMLVVPDGVIPAGGTLTLTRYLPALPAGVLADLTAYQGFVLSSSGQGFTGTPFAQVRLACEFSADCNGDGTPDACEIQSGASTDCNANGVPDGCEIGDGLTDCNQNGIADLCDIQAGTSVDCDENGVPDECEYDCNQNGVADACDVQAGTSADCDRNGVPDECDVDCNQNGVPDACDIAMGTSLDANGNGVPDECQSPTDVYYVDAGGPPYGGDGSPALPFDTLRKGIDYAIAGNTLVVRDGTYTGPDNRDLEFAGRDLVLVSENGPAACVIDCENAGRAFLFDGGETLAARLEGLTIRAGRSQSAAVDPQRGGGVLIRAGSAATLVQCVIESCSAQRYGGGIYVAPESDATLLACTLRANTAGGSAQGHGGGGLSSYGSPSTGTLVLSECVVADNVGFQGGGLMLASGLNVVADCLVEGNGMPAFAFGGGIWHLGTGDAVVRGSSVLANDGARAAIHSESKGRLHVSHCLVAGNTSTSNGGGIGVRNFFMPTLEATIEHCLIAGNSAGSGGGIVAIDVPRLVVRDCTLVDNTASTGGGLNVSNVADASIANSIVWGNAASFQGPSLRVLATPLSVEFCDVEGGLAAVVTGSGGTVQWGPGNLDALPAFVDADGPDDDGATWDDNDYRLGSGSPCTDAGDNAAVLADALDLDDDGDTGEPVSLDLDLLPRFVDDPLVPDTGSGTPPLVDLGAYERH